MEFVAVAVAGNVVRGCDELEPVVLELVAFGFVGVELVGVGFVERESVELEFAGQATAEPVFVVVKQFDAPVAVVVVAECVEGCY